MRPSCCANINTILEQKEKMVKRKEEPMEVDEVQEEVKFEFAQINDSEHFLDQVIWQIN